MGSCGSRGPIVVSVSTTGVAVAGVRRAAATTAAAATTSATRAAAATPAAAAARAATTAGTEAGSADPERERVVMQGGRAKAYRPLPAPRRRAAFAAGLAAYARGDYFEAHELLEPAWMGTDDPIERDLDQGLIKLAAGMVHAVRGNPAGVVNNMRGASARLSTAAAADPWAGGLDLPRLLTEIERCRAAAERLLLERRPHPRPSVREATTRRERRPPLVLEAPPLRPGR